MPSHLTLASSQAPDDLTDSGVFDCAADDPRLSSHLSVVGGSTSAWGFIEELADMPAGDARKVTLLQAVRLADGRRGAVIDQGALADRLERSGDTVQQHLNALAADGWVTVGAARTPSGHWANEYRLGRAIRG